MKKSYSLLAFLYVSLFLNMKILSQCMMVEVAVEQRVHQSELVIEGKIIEKQCYWDAKQKKIYTANTVEVYKILKGTLAADKIELLTIQ